MSHGVGLANFSYFILLKMAQIFIIMLFFYVWATGEKGKVKEWYVGIFHKWMPIKIFFKIYKIYKDSRFEAEAAFY